jgi:predicted lipoprotein with Yx(FWY)xxD motif
MLCLVSFALVLAAGCMQTTPAPATAPVTTAAPVTPPLSTDTVKTASSSLGSVLTDSHGMTLYFFTADIPGSGISTCYDPCTQFWPVFYTPSPAVSPPLATADFAVIKRDDGTLQTSYKGWPLYYYLSDKQAGDMKGEGVAGSWFVARPDYSVMLSRQPGAGQFLTDGSGRTLYFLATETAGETDCTGACLTTWPAFYSGPLVAPSVLNSTDFALGKRPDGN